MKNQFLFSLLILAFAINSFAGPVEVLKTKAQIPEGNYKIFRGDEDLCEVVMELEYIGDAKASGVRVGQKYTWGGLQQSKITEEGGPGCTTEIANTVEKHHIKSVSHFKCKKASDNLVITQELLFEKDQLRINYERIESDKKNNKNYYCVYKLKSP